MRNELLALLATMKSHATAERAALRSLNARQLFELAREGETLAQKLDRLLQRTTQADVASEGWSDVTKAASEVRALSRANHELMRRSLDVIRAVKRPLPSPGDEPAFVSQRA